MPPYSIAPKGGSPESAAQPARSSVTMQTDRSPTSFRAKLAATKSAQMAAQTKGVPASVAKLAAANAAPPPPQGNNPVFVPPQAAAAPAPGQKTNVEAPEPSQAEATNQQALSPQFAALARKERQFREAQKALKAREEALKAREEAMIPKSRLAEDPLGVLSEAGLTYDQLTELQLRQGQEPTETAADKKIAELEARLAKYETQITDRDKQAYDQALTVIRSDAKLLVDSDPAFETTKALGEYEEVVELIKKVFETEGTILSVEEAARHVEDALVERETKRYETLTKLQKIQSKLAPPAAPAEGQEANPLKPQPSKTLTNQGTGSRPLSARERAILAFEGKLEK